MVPEALPRDLVPPRDLVTPVSRVILTNQAIVPVQGAGHHRRTRCKHMAAVRRKRREESRFKVRTVARKFFGINLESYRHPIDEAFVSINLVLQRLGDASLRRLQTVSAWARYAGVHVVFRQSMEHAWHVQLVRAMDDNLDQPCECTVRKQLHSSLFTPCNPGYCTRVQRILNKTNKQQYVPDVRLQTVLYLYLIGVKHHQGRQG